MTVERLPCFPTARGGHALFLIETGEDHGDGGSSRSNGGPNGRRRNGMKKFIIAGVVEKDGDWYALGTYDGRFLQLPLSDEEAENIQPHLSNDRTYGFPVEQERVMREGEALVTAPSGATA
jgi:hypothetical protein